MAASLEIVKGFRFEAAHNLPSFPEGHPYRRLHGHSFRAEVALSSNPVAPHQWIMDFGQIDSLLADLRSRLDHGFLNEIDGLAQPTLETIAVFIAAELEPRLPGLVRVSVFRDSCAEACHLRLGRVAG